MFRATVYRVLASESQRLPLRLTKGLLLRLNRTLGEPLADQAELDRRALAAARLADSRAAKTTSTRTKIEAPILVYFERDRNVRELERIRELLGSGGFSVKELDITGDEATLDFVCRTARCERDVLPVVFVGPTAVGPYPELVKWNVSGALKRAVAG